MSEKAAQIYDRARRSDMSPAEAWDDLRALADEIDWDVEEMLSDSNADADAVSDRELPQ